MRKNTCKLFTFAICIALCASFAAFLTFWSTQQNEANAQQVGATSAWEATDFTYGNVEDLDDCEQGKKLYGCDYSRQFYVKGRIVTGFSESGEAKLAAGNTALVIPREDVEGNTLVGVGPSAFKEKGLTSVEFPTGMKVAYEDTLTKYVTRRGNFIIFESAFMKNNLTEVNLPDGVIACLSNSFYMNNIKTVKLPRTIWWIETQSFARNEITDVIFPQTTDFQLEMHGMAFASNKIKQVRLPDFTAVVNKTVFAMNTGMEKVSDACPTANLKSGGVVYMYTDNASLADLDRIHTTSKTTESQKSWVQKLVTKYNTYTSSTQWLMNDFTYEENISSYTAKITGLSESGIAKRKVNPNMVIPEQTPNGCEVTEIAASTNTTGGLFATSTEKLESVTFSTKVKKIGDNAFREAGLVDANFNNALEEIGTTAFQQNSLTSVVLPDSVKKLGNGAFASNATLQHISLSSSLTEIPNAAFGCSDAKNYMTALTKITIPNGVTKIGARAFAGNNFHEIAIPENVTEIGEYAFSTKNYLSEKCTLTLPYGLKTIGNYAFRNKVVEEVNLPTSVESLPKNVFLKEYSDDTVAVVTKVYVKNPVQATDKTNFPNSEHHTIIYDGTWLPSDFTFGASDVDSDRWVVTGLSDAGKQKLTLDNNLVLPLVDESGKNVEGVGKAAFASTALASVTFSTQASAYVIGESAFENCALTQVALPASLSVVGASAFAGNAISQLEIPSSVKTISKAAFKNNPIEALEIPASVATIGDEAFKNEAPAANYLSSITMSEGLTSIGKEAFAGCTLASSELPTTVSTMDASAFGSTEVQTVQLLTRNKSIANGGTSIKVKGNNYAISYSKLATTGWVTSDFAYDGETLLGYSETGLAKRTTKTLTNLVLPDVAPDGTTIKSIADSTNENTVFGCPESEVHYGSSDDGNVISEFGKQSVQLPASVEYIGNNAFRFNNLTQVSFPITLKKIGEMAFKGNKLTSITLSDNVTVCGNGCFSNNNITQAKLSNSMPIIPEGFLSMNIRMTQIKIPDCVTEIQQTAFAGARLTTLAIPKNVTTIGRKAFHLHHLTELTIPGNVKTIGENAFEGTYKAQTLKKLTISDGVKAIGNGAFKEGLLTSVELPKSVTSFGTKVFENNSGVDPNGNDHRVKVYVAGSTQGKLVDSSANTEFAVWMCSVKFNSQGGSSVAAKTVESGSKVAKPSNPTRSGYAFVHWFSDSKCTKAFDFNAAVSEDVTLYAGWEVEKTTMWRLYNQWSGEHLYTMSEKERDDLANIGWKKEGVAWTAPAKSSTPVYRLYNKYSGDHHYTTSSKEYSELGNIGWTQEGVGWYSDDSHGQAIYRLYNPYVTIGTHHFTSSLKEYNDLGPVGWQQEGFAWYGVSS